jgi:hypothetical protein
MGCTIAETDAAATLDWYVSTYICPWQLYGACTKGNVSFCAKGCEYGAMRCYLSVC